MNTKTRLSALICALFFIISCQGKAGVYDNNNTNNNTQDAGNDAEPDITILCPNGTDLDNDGYGDGCNAGPDCNDSNPFVNPGAQERCNGIDDNCDGQTDEGVLNACGTCSSRCNVNELGTDPFPIESEDPNAETEGTGRDENGDIVLSKEDNNYNFMYIANTNDLGRGTVSKIDTRTVKEVARYLSVTCWSKPSLYLQQGLCRDVNNTNVQTTANSPSRTSVDFNFDVFVANRAFSGQASVTKIASKLSNCIDRNGDGLIQTSSDQNNDGVIDTDCNDDGLADDIATICTNGLPPEFYGLDDECIIFTTNYGVTNQLGRNVCLDKGDLEVGASNVWVGTYNPSSANPISPDRNIYYKIDGTTGAFLGYQILPAGVSPYGCAIDQDGILWVSSWGVTTFIDTVNPAFPVGPVLSISSQIAGSHSMYGITIDDLGNVWFGGWGSSAIYRYRPNRITYGDPDYYNQLAAGTWTRVQYSANTAGVAADTRGFIWAADNNNGLILRMEQSLPDGDHGSGVVTVMNAGQGFGGNMRGVGIDFDGHVWGVSHDVSRASRIELDGSGNMINTIQTTPVGTNPYTYSDFTGYGLHNFTRPQGVYSYTFTACEGTPLPPKWHGVEWTSTEPTGTDISLYVQVADNPSSFATSEQYGPWENSIAYLDDSPGPAAPNPSWYIKVIFLLTTEARDITPILHDFNVIFECQNEVPEK